MSYRISLYTKNQAKRLGVVVKSSKVKGKKLDVFSQSGEKLASVGALGYGDFPTFMRTKGKAFADEKRRLYKIRHQKTRVVKYSPSWYADNLLW